MRTFEQPLVTEIMSSELSDVLLKYQSEGFKIIDPIKTLYPIVDVVDEETGETFRQLDQNGTPTYEIQFVKEVTPKVDTVKEEKTEDKKSS